MPSAIFFVSTPLPAVPGGAGLGREGYSGDRSLRPVAAEILVEEQQMVREGATPVGGVVAARADGVFVADVAVEHLAVESLVDGEEEVVGAAVEDDRERGSDQMELVDDHVLVPHGGVGAVIAQQAFDLPTVGEGPEIHPAARCAAGAECILMAYGEPHGAVPAHAEARDGASGGGGQRAVVAVDVVDELFRHIGLVARLGAERAVEVPRVGPVGAYDDKPVGVGQRGQIGADVGPQHRAAVVAV